MLVTTTRRPFEITTPNLRRLNRIFDEAFGTNLFDEELPPAMASAWMPACDIFEEKDHLKLMVEIPGVKPADVKLSLESNMLTIRGEKKQVAEEKTEKVHRYERSYGVFERSFSLPSTVDAERIDARYDQGVLTVLLPKVEKARPREIPVKGS